MADPIFNAYDLVSFLPVDPPERGQRVHLLGDSQLSGGVGGWDAVERPRRVAASEWTGLPAWTIALPIRLDHMLFRDGTEDGSVEATIERFIAWTRPQPSTGLPQVFLLDGPLKVPSSNPRWVITGIEWGTEYRRPDRHRIAQEMTVTLVEYTRAQVQLGPAARART